MKGYVKPVFAGNPRGDGWSEDRGRPPMVRTRLNPYAFICKFQKEPKV
jgi:hypothetical protein